MHVCRCVGVNSSAALHQKSGPTKRGDHPLQSPFHTDGRVWGTQGCANRHSTAVANRLGVQPEQDNELMCLLAVLPQ